MNYFYSKNRKEKQPKHIVKSRESGGPRPSVQLILQLVLQEALSTPAVATPCFVLGYWVMSPEAFTQSALGKEKWMPASPSTS